MLIVSCSHGRHLGTLITKKLKNFYKSNASHTFLATSKFPDGELHVRFERSLKKETVVLVQSFYKEINDCIVEAVLAAKTAAQLGAKKLILVAPYFPYLRQDKRFHAGEAISQNIVGSLVGAYFDEVYVIDPHLHRTRSLERIFKIKVVKLTSNPLIVNYIKKNIKNPVIIGPDEESYKWARHVADSIGAESRILRKKRYSSYHVEVRLNKKINLNGRNAVIVDDIVSTGHTILETAKILKKLKARSVYCICVHGIFVGDSLNKLKKAGIKIISANTIPNKMAKIDVSEIIAKSLV